MNSLVFCTAIAGLFAFTACASDTGRTAHVEGVEFTHGISLVSRVDMAVIARAVQLDLSHRPGRPTIRSIAIVSERKAIVSYGPEDPLYGEFCIVERFRGGWRVTQHNSWNA